MKKVWVLLLSALLTACANQQLATVADEAGADSQTTVAATAGPSSTLQESTLAAGQAQRPVRIPPEILQKIGFDLAQFDNEGMLNTGGTKRAIIYEYCIPSARQAVSVITTIDFSAEVKTGSGSKVSCGAQETLVEGNSHQDNFKAIIVQLARLPFVKRIEQSRLE